ncbi:MAG TPA: DUF3786 domain-containing protein [Thermodesulfovibrionia bacterium]|nr:DUF3786 domain-containing protein [Thermodesulfovibrionia bacterium]
MNRSEGEEKAWKVLIESDPDEICQRAGVSYDKKTGLYNLTCLGQVFNVSPLEKSITALSDGGANFIKKLAYFFNLSVPWYLISAKDIPSTGKLIRPEDLPHGRDIFFKGSHVLPLPALENRYGSDKNGFITKCRKLNGTAQAIGDAAFTVYPMPRIPTTVILWLGDEEFPPRMDFLFDSTAEFHSPLDILWSIAMMTTLAFLY